jgi:hypothetical protein
LSGGVRRPRHHRPRHGARAQEYPSRPVTLIAPFPIDDADAMAPIITAMVPAADGRG